jgi:hypothetical protein
MSTAGTGRAPREHEVVAGLVNDRSVEQVAATAVRLARELEARICFVQVVPEGTEPAERAEIESAAFAVALKALRGSPRVHASFEYPSGDPGRLLVERSRNALGLVVGEDDLDAPQGSGGVARFCLDEAGCQVHVVSRRTDPALEGPSRRW